MFSSSIKKANTNQFSMWCDKKREGMRDLKSLAMSLVSLHNRKANFGVKKPAKHATQALQNYTQ